LGFLINKKGDKMNKQAIVEKYTAKKNDYEELWNKVEIFIKEILKVENIKYHFISNRAKEVNSFAKKIDTGKYAKL
jgi:hypothetical protein